MNDVVPTGTDTPTDSVDVVGGEVVSFVQGMSLENREAAKYCHLFATQAATAEHNPTTEGQAWFEFYLQTMQACGWAPIKFTYSEESSSAQQFKLGNLVAKAMQAAAGFVATGGALTAALPAVASNAISALAASDAATSLFKREASKKQGTTLNVASCAEYPNGEVVMTVAAVQSTAVPAHDVSVLVFEWNASSSSTYTGAAALSFHKGLYNKNKDVLEERVGDTARNTLLSLKLKR